MAKKIWLTGCLALVMLAASIYFFADRERHGNYTKQASYQDLYGEASQTEAQQKKWQAVADHFTPEEKQRGKELSGTEAGIINTDTDFEKMVKIGRWLQRSLHAAPRGTPTPGFEQLGIIDKLRAASKAESPVWCGTYGILFLFFCSANDITCRYIEPVTANRRHIVTECYIPELRQWVFTDLMYDAIYCKDKSGKILTTADLVIAHSKQDTVSFTRFSHQSNSANLQAQPASIHHWNQLINQQSQLLFYYTLNKKEVYNAPGKIKRYLYPTTWYEVFSLTRISNIHFYLRLFFLYGFLIVTFILIYIILHDRSKKRSQNIR